MSLLFGVCLIGFIAISDAACPTSATGAWGVWSSWSGPCASCPDACGQTRLRLCIPNPIAAGCIVDGLTCTGEPTETLACAGPTCASTTTTTSTTTSAAQVCGEWSAWSCSCCGGCANSKCTRVCTGTDAPGCTRAICEGIAHQDEPGVPCTSPTESCKMPLAVCCVGQAAYYNATGKARWCKNGA